MSKLVKMQRGDNFADVHPNEVDNYKKGGWLEAAAPVDADGNGYVSVAEIKAKLDELGVEYPKKAKKAALESILSKALGE